MSAPATITEAIVDNAALAQVDYDALKALGVVPEFERSALDHWKFDKGDPTNLIGGKGGLLVANAAAPTHEENHLVTADGGLNGLLTSYDDMLTQTICVVTRRKALTGDGRLLFGSTTTDGGSGGVLAYFNTPAGPILQMRTRPGANTTVPASNIAGLPDNTWFFAALVNDEEGDQTYYIGGHAAVVDAATAKTIGPRKIALGNAYYNSANYLQGSEFFEFIIFDRALSLAELQSVYARSKVRAARQDIALH